MSIANTNPNELVPRIDKLQNGRWRVTRRFRVGNSAQVNDALFAAHGSADAYTPDAGTEAAFADLKLIQEFYTEEPNTQPNARVLVQVYETLTGTFVAEIDDVIDYDLNGLKRVTRQLIAVAGTAVSVAATYGTGYLAQHKIEQNDAYTRITAVYIDAGQVSQAIEYRNNGALEVRTLSNFYSVPSTPAGFVLISERVENGLGFPTTTCSYASGDGEISRDTETRNNGKLLITTIRHLVAPGAANPIASPGAGYALISESENEADGHSVWVSRYAKGDGLVKTSEREGPSAIPGTKYVTHVALGTASVPTGALVESSDSDEDGYVLYTRTALQPIGAGSITGTKATYTDVVDANIPGTVAPTTIAVPEGTIAIANVVPPRSKRVLATVTLAITTTPPTTGSLAYDIGSISCSVTYIKTDNVYVGMQNLGDAISEVWSTLRRVTSSAHQVNYPGCYLTASSSTGSQSYTGGQDESGLGVTNTISTSANGSGATSAADYATTGVLQRKTRPILTTIDGTTYYEVATWTV